MPTRRGDSEPLRRRAGSFLGIVVRLRGVGERGRLAAGDRLDVAVHVPGELGRLLRGARRSDRKGSRERRRMACGSHLFGGSRLNGGAQASDRDWTDVGSFEREVLAPSERVQPRGRGALCEDLPGREKDGPYPYERRTGSPLQDGLIVSFGSRLLVAHETAKNQ